MKNHNITTDTTEYGVRRQKLEELKVTMGAIVAYKDKFTKTYTILEATKLSEGKFTQTCGRVTSKRVFRNFMFLDLYDADKQIQISISQNELGDEYDFYKKSIDIGDHIGICGEIYTTKTGEKTIRCRNVEILSKALRGLPEKYHGLTNSDVKRRKPYLGIISDPDFREAYKTRIRVLQLIRTFLNGQNFVEVETPILQNIACGANARPFTTTHNALDTEYFLRISPELFLKQVVACGFDRIYEIGKNFRNEGTDPSHLQEFTMLEWYVAYWNYLNNIKFLKELLGFLIQEIKGTPIFDYQGLSLNFSDFRYVDYIDEVSNFLRRDILAIEDTAEIKAILKAGNVFSVQEIEEIASLATAIDQVFKRKIRPNLIQPTISYHYPAYMIPLARRNDEDSRVADMFQLIVNGWEIVKGYSELIDPIIQREAFAEQAFNKKHGDHEAMDIDESFILAMEHGMPPMSGVGLGVDRLVALLANQPSLRDIILFSQVKPKAAPRLVKDMVKDKKMK